MGLEDRTEQATPQHRQEARKKGQVAKSMEIVSSFVLLCGLFAVKSSGGASAGRLTDMVARYLGNLSAFPLTPEGIRSLFIDAGVTVLSVTGPVLATVALAGVVANVAQVGLLFSFQTVKPDLNRVNPMAGLGRIFSAKGLMELAKSLAKVLVLAYVAWSFLKSEHGAVMSLSVVGPGQAGRTVTDLVWRLCVRVCSVLLVIASVDYIYQRLQFEKSIRMTKQQVKEEFKSSEGDPQVKAQFRQRHRQMATQRMMQDVPTADVVVTNPTHYAVALKYDGNTMAAPVVVAKGQRLVAQRIKEIARENRVPLVENKPVARALFASAEVGNPVPVELYQAVAEILAFVYRLKHGGATQTA